MAGQVRSVLVYHFAGQSLVPIRFLTIISLFLIFSSLLSLVSSLSALVSSRSLRFSLPMPYFGTPHRR